MRHIHKTKGEKEKDNSRAHVDGTPGRSCDERTCVCREALVGMSTNSPGGRVREDTKSRCSACRRAAARMGGGIPASGAVLREHAERTNNRRAIEREWWRGWERAGRQENVSVRGRG